MILKYPLKSLALISVLGLGALVPVTADEDETPLSEQMDIVSGSLKRLRRAETADDKVELIKAAQAATIKGLEFLPASFKDIKDKKALALATADYKRLTGHVFVALCELEAAVVAGDEEKQDAAVTKLKELKKEGHRAHKSDD